MKGFLQLPRDLAARTDITPAAKVVWAWLDNWSRLTSQRALFEHTPTPASLAKIARGAGLAKRDTVAAAVKQLARAHLLQIIHPSSSASAPSIYITLPLGLGAQKSGTLLL